MSDTPRTDSCVKDAGRYGDMDVVPANVTRDMERDLAVKDAMIREMSELLDGAKPIIELSFPLGKPAQAEWRKNWLSKLQEIATPDKKEESR